MDSSGIVMIPFPAQGHLNPMMRLACKVGSLGIQITFVCSQRFVESAAGLRDQTCQDSVRIVGIQGGVVDAAEQKGNAKAVHAMVDASAEMEEEFEGIVREQMSHGVRCIVSDAFLSWTQDVANRVGVPRMALWTPSAATCVVSAMLGTLIEDGYVPVQEKLEEKGNIRVHGLPGLSLRLKDLPLSYHRGDKTQFQQRVAIFERLREASCILANTFDSLEPEAVAGIKTLVPNFQTIGPLLPSNFFDETGKTLHANSTEDRDCLEWLDKQVERSVVYVSFGSLANISALQVEKIAEGLEASNTAFLWVIRPNLVEGLMKGEFFEAFQVRTKDKGLVVSWAPQLQVLSHPAVTLFITHCGWNSVLEGICSGVPLLGWPCFAEQNVNCKYVVEDWGAGMSFRSSEASGLVESTEVAEVISSALVNKEIRKNVLKLKDAASAAVKDGGSSFASLRKIFL